MVPKCRQNASASAKVPVEFTGRLNVDTLDGLSEVNVDAWTTVGVGAVLKVASGSKLVLLPFTVPLGVKLV